MVALSIAPQENDTHWNALVGGIGKDKWRDKDLNREGGIRNGLPLER